MWSLEIWSEALESKGSKISRNKTEYIECKFSVSRSSHSEGVKIQNQEIPKSEKFRYLGSIFSKDGEIVDDITHRIQVGWLKWRAASEVLCDRRIPSKLKGKFYRTIIRLVIIWEKMLDAKKWQVTKTSVVEMIMLMWICSKTRNDRISNANICLTW